jgi:glycosyltransferase involved in cell wall biosynthesis
VSVSVVICVRDGEAHLAEAIDSALAQSATPMELIVVDDGSQDGSAEIARSYAPRVRLLRQGPLGLGAARNAALEAATGEFIAFLDSDDIWEPNKLELQLAAFSADPALDVCFTHVLEFADELELKGARPRPGPIPGVFTSSLCARRESVRRAGGFDPHARLGETMALLLRLRELGMREAMLPEVLVHRRVHAGNMTRDRRHEFGHYARVLKASLDRRRESA